MSTAQSRFVSVMDQLQERAKAQQSLSLREVLLTLGSEGHAVALLFLIIPFLQPVPMMGLSTPFGALIGLISYYLYKQQPPWIPDRFAQLPVSSQLILKVSEGAEKIWRKLAVLFKERISSLFVGPVFPLLNSFVIAWNAFLLALPIPFPFSNAVPAWPILMMAIAYMERDGLFVVVSYVMSVLGLGFFTALGLAAYYGLTLF